jgi:UDP-N-acetylmuramoyl-tripeptide--D-alanyl-D-alanine ligase
MFKSLIRKKLERYTKKYLAKNTDIKLVAVSGSVGKTSTKMAISTVLAEKFRVRVHEGNYNSEMSVPTAILGIDYPDNIRSLGQWMKVFRQARRRVKQPAEVDVIVQELGTDRVGQLPAFENYLKPDIGVVTAVSAEHMEHFKDLDSVAKEELSLTQFSEQSIINRENIDKKFAKYANKSNLSTYGTSEAADYRYESSGYVIGKGHRGIFVGPEWDKPTSAKLHTVGEHSTLFASAAVAVAAKLGMNQPEIATGVNKIQAVPGRMNILKGRKGSIIIDDTYNSSPLAATAAIRTLYELQAPQKIAVLGSMNELGDMSASAHKELGELCIPEELAWVVVVGQEAAEHLAPAAEAQGCKVQICKNAVEAGSFVSSVMHSGAVLLFKGSEGGIFLEEAVKQVLHSTDDERKLVRQTPEWLAKKQQA